MPGSVENLALSLDLWRQASLWARRCWPPTRDRAIIEVALQRAAGRLNGRSVRWNLKGTASEIAFARLSWSGLSSDKRFLVWVLLSGPAEAAIPSYYIFPPEDQPLLSPEEYAVLREPILAPELVSFMMALKREIVESLRAEDWPHSAPTIGFDSARRVVEAGGDWLYFYKM